MFLGNPPSPSAVWNGSISHLKAEVRSEGSGESRPAADCGGGFRKFEIVHGSPLGIRHPPPESVTGRNLLAPVSTIRRMVGQSGVARVDPQQIAEGDSGGLR